MKQHWILIDPCMWNMCVYGMGSICKLTELSRIRQFEGDYLNTFPWNHERGSIEGDPDRPRNHGDTIVCKRGAVMVKWMLSAWFVHEWGLPMDVWCMNRVRQSMFGIWVGLEMDVWYLSGVGQWMFGILVGLDNRCLIYEWGCTMDVWYMSGVGQWMFGIWMVLDNGCLVYEWCWTMDVWYMNGAGQWMFGIWMCLRKGCHEDNMYTWCMSSVVNISEVFNQIGNHLLSRIGASSLSDVYISQKHMSPELAILHSYVHSTFTNIVVVALLVHYDKWQKVVLYSISSIWLCVLSIENNIMNIALQVLMILLGTHMITIRYIW